LSRDFRSRRLQSGHVIRIDSLVQVPLQIQVIDAIKTKDRKIMVSVRRICEALGIDEDAQRVKLKNAPWARTFIIKAHDTQGLSQKQFMIDLETLSQWLVKIQSTKVNGRATPLLLEFQLRPATLKAKLLSLQFLESPGLVNQSTSVLAAPVTVVDSASWFL
jgi:hypothetical protein